MMPSFHDVWRILKVLLMGGAHRIIVQCRVAMTDSSKDTASANPSGPAPSDRPDAPVAEGADRKPESARPPETGGPKGPEPTRYGDWEKGGRCIDF